MLAFAFFSWWYGSGWKQVADSLGPRTRMIAQTFSIDQLLRTLFAPWKKIITYPGASLNDKVRAWGDNLFSRVIGFIVRLSVLIAALVALTGIALVTLVEILVWPLLPLAIPACVVIGATL